MQQITVADLQANCHSLVEQVVATGETLLIMEHGKPAVELRPVQSGASVNPFGLHKGKTKILGDIITPLDDQEWEVLD
ncbi:type II toxin-antitoxin system Phd/YefM family antitoxin [Desulfonatronum parangueonense]